MKRSSTSSSSVLRDTGKAIALAMGVFVAGTVAVQLAPRDALVPTSTGLRSVARADLRYATAGEPAAEVVLMGTSRLETVPTKPIAARARLPEDHVLNLSVPRNSFFFMYSFIRENPDVFRNTKVVFVDFMAYQFGTWFLDGETGLPYLRYGGLRELGWSDKRQVGAVAFADTLVPMWSRTQSLSNWITGSQYLALEPEQALKQVQGEEFRLGLRALKHFQMEFDENPRVKDLRPLDVSEIQVKSLESICENLPEHVTFALVWLPFSEAEHERRMRTDREMFLRVLGEGRALAERFVADYEQVVMVDVTDWLDSPLTDADYAWDGVHFEPSGRKKIANALGGLAAAYMAKDKDVDATKSF